MGCHVVAGSFVGCAFTDAVLPGDGDVGSPAAADGGKERGVEAILAPERQSQDVFAGTWAATNSCDNQFA